MKKRWKRNLSLYQKFCLVIITLGLIPMLFLSTVIVNRMFKAVSYTHLDVYKRQVPVSAVNR